jgi:sortase A
MGAERRRLVLRWIERALLGVGAACLAWYTAAAWRAHTYQAHQQAIAERSTLPGDPASQPRGTSGITPGRPARAVPAPASGVAPGSPIGSLEIARVHLLASIVEGDDDASLEIAVGHLPDTPMPWEEGNSAFAAHRDTFFRPLRNVRPADEVRLATSHGDFRYRVVKTMIVNPEDLWVLDPTARPTVTLITCYPFNYVGHAPQRYVVRAERIP